MKITWSHIYYNGDIKYHFGDVSFIVHKLELFTKPKGTIYLIIMWYNQNYKHIV